MKSESSKSVRISQKIAPMPSAYCRAFRTGKGADRPASEKSPFCTGFIGRSSALLLQKESADERSIPRFPPCQTVLCRGLTFFPLCEVIIRWVTDDFPPCEAALHEGSADFPLCQIIIGWITDDFPLCETTLCRGFAFFPPCEIIIGWITDDFQLCETTLCRGLAFFPPCETALCRGFPFFPPCETFVGWVMKEFPYRKLVRDGYEVHCLPAIRLETVTDSVLAVAIGLEMLTEEIATLTK